MELGDSHLSKYFFNRNMMVLLPWSYLPMETSMTAVSSSLTLSSKVWIPSPQMSFALQQTSPTNTHSMVGLGIYGDLFQWTLMVS
jgi:hypothetical protein